MAPPFAQKPSRISQLKADASRARTSKADIERDLDTARGRREYFSNRPNVSDDRSLRRMKQADELQQFKNLYTKPVQGSSNLLQMTSDAPRSLRAETERLANQYGPTFREIGSDIGYGLGSIAKGFAEKGTPLISLLKGLYGKGKDFFTQGIPSALKGESQFDTPVYQSSPSLFEGKPTETFVPPTFNNQKINTNRLDSIFPPSKMNDETFENEVMKYLSNTNINDYRAENVGLPSLVDLYNLSQNPEINTNMGNFRLDNVFTGDPRLGYSNTVMINGVPVDLSANIGQGGNLGLGASLMFKDGGTVDKYSGLGYKLR